MVWFLLLDACVTAPVPSPEADADTDTDTDTDADTDVDTDADADTDLPDGALGPAAAPCGTPAEGVVFEDVSVCAGFSPWHILPPPGGSHWYAMGQALADVDGDGWLDIVVSSQDGSNRLYLGGADGRFTERVQEHLQEKPGGPTLFVDVENDGDPDLLLGGKGESWFFENVGGVFEPMASAPTLPGMVQGLTAGDLDGDGLPEVYAAQYHCPECFDEGVPYLTSSADQLFSFVGTGWVDRTASVGSPLHRSGLGFLGSMADLDGDGDGDLHVLNDFGSSEETPPDGPMNRNLFYRNDGLGCGWVCLSEVGRTVGLDLRMDAMGIAVEDPDHDGDLDVLVTDTTFVSMVVNERDGFQRFLGNDVLEGFGTTWGVSWLDVDNDADLDVVVVATGGDRLYFNDGAGNYTLAAETAGIEDAAVTYGLAVADYDRDGRLDLVIGDRGIGYRLLRNVVDNDHHWIGLRLVGASTTRGGRDALGARVVVTDTAGRTHMREVQAGTSFGGGSDLGVHIGLGTASIASAVVLWPDGERTTLQAPLLDAWSVVSR